MNSYDDALAKFAVLLRWFKVPAGLNVFVAEGVIQFLRHHCWANTSDLLGSKKDLAKLLNYEEGEALVELLEESQLIDIDKKNNEYLLPFAVREAPDYVRKRWRRDNLRSYNAARTRARSLVLGPTESPEPECDLFGDPIYDKEADKENKATPGHRGLTDFWCTEWERIYRQAYPFGRRDGPHIKAILATAGGLERGREVISAFLADTDSWIVARGHKLGILVNDLPRFILAAGKAGPPENREADAAELAGLTVRIREEATGEGAKQTRPKGS